MPHHHSVPSRSNARGFSLVLSLTVMAMLLLLCISAAAMLAIELRVSRATISHTKARLNAIAAARVALGSLQGYAGPDRRITAPSSILDTTPGTWEKSEGMLQPRLTGVWRGIPVGSKYKDTHNAAFLGWLSSGSGTASLDYPQKTDSTGGIRLLSKPANPDKGLAALDVTDEAEVRVLPDNILDSAGGSAGSVAWWVADENTKANVSLRLPPATPAPTPADALAMAQNAPRLGLKVNGDGAFGNFPESSQFQAPSYSRDSLSLDPASSSSANGWLGDARNYYHDITPYSESLLTDVVNGGLKYDLSLMLALDKLPDGYRNGAEKVYPFFYDVETAPTLKNIDSHLSPAPVGLESTVPGAGPYAKAKGGWLTAIPPGTFPSPSSAASGLLTFNKLDWTVWSDVWSFARIYRLAEPAFKDTNRNLNLFDPKGGLYIFSSRESMRGLSYWGTTNTNTQNFLDRTSNNAVDMGNMTPWRMPIITAIQVAVSVRAVPTGTPGKSALTLVVRPYLQLWNPYNVPLRFGPSEYDSLELAVRILPGKLKVTTRNIAGAIQETQSWNDWSFNQGYGGAGALLSMFVAMYEAPLAPGEVRVYTPRNPTIIGRNTRDDGATQVTPGLRPFGGYEFAVPVQPFDGDVTVSFEPNDGPAIPGDMARPDTHISMDWMLGRNDGAIQNQCTGHGVRVEWNNDPEVALKIDSATTDVSQSQLQQPQGQAFARFTMRLRSETTSTHKSPFLAYGDIFRQVHHPKSIGSFRNNPEMKLSPFEFCHSKINADTDLNPDNPSLECDGSTNRGYAFTGYTPGDGGVSALVLSHIPLAPIASLGDLRDARLGGGVSYSRLLQTIWDGHTDPITGFQKSNRATLLTGGRSVVQDPLGNSFGHPMITADKITAVSAHGSENYYDFSWIMNSSLWDAYCATGFSPENSSVPAFAGRTFGKLADDFLLNGGYLANRRILFRDYGIGGAAIKTLLVNGDKPTDEAFAKATAAMSVNGGFNINSTSVRAWRALLAGLNRAVVPQLTPSTPLSDPTVSPEIDPAGVALRNPIQSGPLAPVNTGSYDKAFNDARALAGRKLSEDQLTELAQKIVEQVKLRGPFLSLGEFMNRRIETGPFCDRGAIQAAIDATNINAFAKSSSVKQVTTGDTAGFTNPAAATGSQARGMPGFVCQADIVAPIATQLSARSDTFVIRAAGTSDDGAVAYVEFVVRRTTKYLDSRDEPFALPKDPAKPLKIANEAFGRRFVPVATRWLSSENI